MTSRRLITFLIFALAFLSIAAIADTTEPATPAATTAQATAADATADAAYSEAITVVGSRIAPLPERIPGAVTLIDRASLESARPLSTSEALRKAPGVTVRDEEGLSLRPNIGFRGTNPTRSTKVLLLEDGVPLTYAPYGDNASYYHPPIERFEGIEIVKGSGQIAFGPTTVGGVVNYLTPDPPSQPSLALLLTAGSRDYFNGHLTYGGTWGKTGVLVDFMRKEGAGARDNTFSELTDVNAKFVYSISDSQALTFRANYYGEESNLTYSGMRQSEYEANPRGNPFVNDFFYGDRFGASLAHRMRIGEGLQITTTAYGASFSRDWWRQSSNSGQRPNDASDPNCGGMANLLTTCGNEGRLRDYTTFGLEPRAQWTTRAFGAAHELQTGLRVHVESQERLQVNGDTPAARSGRTVENNARDNTAFAAFVQDRITFGRLSITPGVRIEKISYERTNRLANNNAGAHGTTELTQIVPGVGASWISGETTIFAGIHRGFAPPRTEDIITNAGGLVDLDPELSWNSEIGIRTAPRSGLTAEATLFHVDYENQVVPASVAGGVGATLTNGGATTHQGAELSARVDSAALFSTPHNVYATFAYTNLWEASFNGPRRSNISGHSNVDVGGNRLPYAPEETLTAGLGYLMPAGIEFFVEAVRVSEQFADDLNTVAPTADGQRGLIPASTVWNATVNYDVRPLRTTLFVSVKNAFDELYIVDRSRGILPGMPRVFQAGMKFRY